MPSRPGGDGGPACSGRFDEKGSWKSELTTRTTRYDQAGKQITGVERVFDTKVFDGNVWGLEWFYQRHQSQRHVPAVLQTGRRGTCRRPGRGSARRDAVADAGVQTGRARCALHVADHRRRSRPGPKSGPFTVKLADGSVVTYSGTVSSISRPCSNMTGAPKRRRRSRPLWSKSMRTGRSIGTTWRRPAGEPWRPSMQPCS